MREGTDTLYQRIIIFIKNMMILGCFYQTVIGLNMSAITNDQFVLSSEVTQLLGRGPLYLQQGRSVNR